MTTTFTTLFNWVGGKSSAFPKLRPFIDRAIRDSSVYVEPFVGGLGMTLSLINAGILRQGQSIILNDKNPAVINFYEHVKNEPENLIRWLSNLRDQTVDRDLFQEAKNIFNSSPKSSFKSACTFYFLMQTCFNGVYRENQRGEFNSSIGRAKEKLWGNVFTLDKQTNLERLSDLFNDWNIEFRCEDYSKILDEFCERGNFVYCDPPYYAKSPLGLYMAERFDHQKFFTTASEKFCEGKMAISDSDFSEVWEGLGDYVQNTITVKQSLKRGNVEEILAVDYD
jgi:DNA adenine methylase